MALGGEGLNLGAQGDGLGARCGSDAAELEGCGE
jgi:hypothetical protein